MLKKLFNELFLVAILLLISSCALVTHVPYDNNNNDNAPLSDQKDIIAFSIDDRAGVISDTTITVTMPFGSSVDKLIPVIEVSAKATIDPASEVEQNFKEPVLYTVTAEDGSTKEYTVIVAVARSDAKDISEFTLAGVKGTIDEKASPKPTIDVTVPFGTKIKSLKPTIVITGVSVDPASGVAHDFSSPVTFTVTAADDTTKEYVVTVKEAPSNIKGISLFQILGVAGTITDTEITLTLPAGTDLKNLTPTITTIGGSTVSPASGVAQDFSSNVKYTVTAQDLSTKEYTVKIALEEAYIPGYLTVPGAHQGWDPTDMHYALYSVNTIGKYEGYMYMPNPCGYKFTDGSWNHIWGDDGSLSGKLASGGNDIQSPNFAVYRLNVDLNNMTYSAVPTVWGVIGSATSGGWGSSLPMTYSGVTKLWSITTDLVVGEFKFMANGDWGVMLGTDGSPNKVTYTGANILVPSDGNYTIYLDLRQQSGAGYAYSIIAN